MKAQLPVRETATDGTCRKKKWPGEPITASVTVCASIGDANATISVSTSFFIFLRKQLRRRKAKKQARAHHQAAENGKF